MPDVKRPFINPLHQVIAAVLPFRKSRFSVDGPLSLRRANVIREDFGLENSPKGFFHSGELGNPSLRQHPRGSFSLILLLPRLTSQAFPSAATKNDGAGRRGPPRASLATVVFRTAPPEAEVERICRRTCPETVQIGTE